MITKVNVRGGGLGLPLQLKSYIKTDTSVTNFRLDYTYQPTVFSSASKWPPLKRVTFTLPMDGGVQNAVTKPTGIWSTENASMIWVVGEIPPIENPGE